MFCQTRLLYNECSILFAWGFAGHWKTTFVHRYEGNKLFGHVVFKTIWKLIGPLVWIQLRQLQSSYQRSRKHSWSCLSWWCASGAAWLLSSTNRWTVCQRSPSNIPYTRYDCVITSTKFNFLRGVSPSFGLENDLVWDETFDFIRIGILM